jgi:cyclohexa-1,5-dienecarbonyl-CoA hydratase
MTETKSPVHLEVRNDVAYITLDSPPLNILTISLMDAITETLGKVAADSSVKAVAFTANGKAFSAGADVDEHRPEKIQQMIGSFGRMFRTLSELEVPCVMAVNGPALGGGFELAMMADILIANEKATFGQPEIRLGFFAPVGVVVLPARVGPGRAMEITCSGRTYSAADMHEFGLVSRVVPLEELENALESTLKDFRHASPLVMRLNVRTLKRIYGGSHFSEALATAEKAFLEELMATEDVREGIASFFEKRKPVWKNQ